MIKPLVSVLISAYNHEMFIQDTIKSIIEQTYENIELIIIDDGSKDKTFEKINEMKIECEKRFLHFISKTQKNVGAAITTNRIITYASGKYCFLMASDDVLKPNAVKTLVDFLEYHDDYLFAVGDNEFIDENNNKVCIDDTRDYYNIANKKSLFKFSSFIRYATNRLKRDYPDLLKGRYNRAKLENVEYSDLWCDCLTPIASLIRKKALEAVLPYSVNCPEEDLYLLYQLAKNGKIKVLDKVLASYRIHKNNTIKNTDLLLEKCRLTNYYEMYLLDTKYKNIDLSEVLKSNWFKVHYDSYKLCKKYFDEKYYLEKYPYVIRRGFIPLVHYLAIGVYEGLYPSRWFENHPKKVRKGTNPIVRKKILTLKYKIFFRIWKYLGKQLRKRGVISQLNYKL